MEEAREAALLGVLAALLGVAVALGRGRGEDVADDGEARRLVVGRAEEDEEAASGNGLSTTQTGKSGGAGTHYESREGMSSGTVKVTESGLGA